MPENTFSTLHSDCLNDFPFKNIPYRAKINHKKIIANNNFSEKK